MNEIPSNNELIDLDELLDSQEFHSRPTVYFSPFENLGDKMGVYRFTIQVMEERVLPQVKRTKRAKSVKIYELVVRVLEDCRAGEVNQCSQDKRYLFDAGEEVMTRPVKKLQTSTRRFSSSDPSVRCSSSCR